MRKIKNCKIGVISGGVSSEREISLESGMAVFNALKANGLNAELIDINEENYCNFLEMFDFDIAFIALHGKFGEDGQIQKILEEKGIGYTGSGPEASRRALDKIESKIIFKKAGLSVPDYKIVNTLSGSNSLKFSVPCVVKPRYEGSSVGLFTVKDDEFLVEAVKAALQYEQDVIIEEFIQGKEITVGVIAEKALPLIEIMPSGGIYDFESKYKAIDTKYVIPADMKKNEYVACQEAGLKAHKALGCRGFSRTDIRLSKEGQPYVLEVNTIPGLTERSLLPMAAKHTGLDFFQLCVKMIEASVCNMN